MMFVIPFVLVITLPFIDERKISTIFFLAIILLPLAGMILATNRLRRLATLARNSRLRLCTQCAAPYESESKCHACGCVVDFEFDEPRWRALVLRYSSGKEREPLSILKRIYRPLMLLIPIAFASVFATQFLLMRAASGGGRSPDLIGSLVLFFILFFSAYGAVIVMYLFSRGKQKILLNRAAEHDFCMCETCGYPLPADAPQGDCPECGHGYRVHDLCRRWYEAWGSSHLHEAIEIKVPLTIEEA